MNANLIKQTNCGQRPTALILSIGILLALAGCGQKQQMAAPPPPEVGVITIQVRAAADYDGIARTH